MGQVGENGSVVWQNKHQNGSGKFKDKNGKGKLAKDELRKLDKLEVWGHDDVANDDIGKTEAPDLVFQLKGFQKPKYFLVRLRFDDADATAIRNWFAAAPAAVPENVRMVTEGRGDSVVMAINVKGVYRPTWPDDDVSFDNMPWEIRYDW